MNLVDTIISQSAEETRAAARRLAERLGPGAVIRLDGEVGAGKTEFVKGLAEGFGSADEVTSPTFPIVQEYLCADGLPLFHIDFYRLENASEAERLGLWEMFDQGRCTVAEWGGKFPALLPPDAVVVRIAQRENGAREICIGQAEAGA